MQKIQFYLVPNRMVVTTDRVGFNTEYRQVYQRKLKLYKGINNTIQLDIRNSEQRKADVIGYTADILFFDTDRKKLFEVSGTPITSQPGQISITVEQTTLDTIDPQNLLMAARLTKTVGPTTTELPLYIDGQFELVGHVQLLDGYNEKLDDLLEELTTFNYEYDSKEYVSEIGRFGTSMNDDHASSPRSITVEFDGTFEGIMLVEATKDMSTAFGTTWERLADWDVVATPSKDYTGDYRFIRFRFGGDNRTGSGSGARFTVVKNGGVYTSVTTVLRGQNYSVGDELTIMGSFLGGDDGVNDLVITVAGINVSPPGAINTTQLSWTGTPTAGFEIFESVSPDGLAISSKPVDKIIIRN
jgi:hypothetical protein